MDLVEGCSNVILVGVVSILLLVFFLLRKSKVDQSREAPLADGGWPIIGHLALFNGSKLPHLTLGALADKHGPIFTIKIGSKRALVVSDWKMAKECYTTNDMAILSRPNLASGRHLTYNGAMFGSAPGGPYWREIRKICASELLSSRRVEQLSPVRVSEVETFIKELFKCWAQKNNDSSYVRVELRQWFGKLTMNAVLRMVAGKRYFGAQADADPKEGQKCLDAIRKTFHHLGLLVPGDAFPYLRWLDLGGHEKAMKETAAEMDVVLGEWLKEHKQKGALTSEQDFIHTMLSVLHGVDNLAGFDPDTIIKGTSSTLITGAVDTSAATLTWAISNLLNNPHALREAQKELDLQVGEERGVKESDLSKLVYIQSIVKETLRLHPPATLSGPREFAEDCTIGGYHVKKGTQLITNLRKIQTDPSIWSNPLEFQPERFLTTHKDVDVRGHHFELIPFGSGRRMCPGISFGLQMVQFTLATFLHSFEISKPSNEPIDMTEVFGLTSMKATPLEVLVKPRYPNLLGKM